jgi:hypothetical protein
MGVPTSEVGYTLATTGRGDHQFHKGYVVTMGRKTLHQNLRTSLVATALHNRDVDLCAERAEATECFLGVLYDVKDKHYLEATSVHLYVQLPLCWWPSAGD